MRNRFRVLHTLISVGMPHLHIPLIAPCVAKVIGVCSADFKNDPLPLQKTPLLDRRGAALAARVVEKLEARVRD